MGKTLAGKTGFIFAILAIFAFGIIGIPHGGLRQSLRNRIHLGLDLRGGTHLVLQVQVAEAVGSATDRDIQRLNGALATNAGVTATKLEPIAHPERSTITGVTPAAQCDIKARCKQ